MAVIKDKQNIFLLFASLVGRTVMEFTDNTGKVHCSIVNAIEAEDGSGKSWIVTLSSGSRLYVRTL